MILIWGPVLASVWSRPAALAQRLSTPRGGRKTPEALANNLAAATEKRDAHLRSATFSAFERTEHRHASNRLLTAP